MKKTKTDNTLNKPFRWAVIGTGRIANTVMKEVTATGRHRVVSVYSRTYEKAEKFAAKFDATVYTSLKDAVCDSSVEGVYIATPHSAHYRQMLECIDLDKPVLCEKAFTVNTEQAEAVYAAAKEKGVFVCEAMWMRFNPVVQQVSEWIKDGEIGDVISLEANFCLPLKAARPFVGERVYTADYAGGALLDLGVYPIAYAHTLLGYPQGIECTMRIEDDVDYDDRIILEYPRGIAILNSSFDRLLTYKATILGTKGHIISPMFYKPLSATLVTDEKRVTKRHRRGYIYEFDACAEDIRKGLKESPVMTHRHSLDVMQIMDVCRQKNNFNYPNSIEKL